MAQVTEDDLGHLHGLVCKVLTAKATRALEHLENPPEPDPEGGFVMAPELTAAEMTVAVALLKNSSITCKRNVGSALDDLANQLAKKAKGKATEQDVTEALASHTFQQAH